MVHFLSKVEVIEWLRNTLQNGWIEKKTNELSLIYTVSHIH